MQFIAPQRDLWHALGGEDGPPVSINPEPYLLLDRLQWRAVRAFWPAATPVGLKLANARSIPLAAALTERFADLD